MTTSQFRKTIGPISRWLIGFFIGTCVIAITSPWFVRSYVPLVVDPIREVWTLAPDTTYRWRREGHANSKIGPHGMPGQTEIADASTATVVALWGDSQAEGVAVDDHDKLFAQLQENLPKDWRAKVYPLARSGEDGSVWAPQMRRVEERLSVDLHVILLVDWEDLQVLADATSDSAAIVTDSRTGERFAWARILPAFVIQGARNLLTTEDGSTRRRLRWSVGPETTPATAASTSTPQVDWDAALFHLRSAADKPVWIVHAPRRPEIVAGNVVTDAMYPDLIRELAESTRRHGIDWIDVSDAFLRSAGDGVWPHGFHNGQIGVGHLNPTGYRLIAEAIAGRWAESPPADLVAN